MKLMLCPWLVLKPALRHIFSTFEQCLLAGGSKTLFSILLSVILFWHLYTPIHELMHAGMCLAGGGTVTELAIKAQYGGTLLAQIFPFVVADSDYAGQLTGFTTPNYWVYAAVDFAPYLLSLVGLILIEYVRRGKSAMLFGLGIILALIPFMSVPGDYYEAASLLTTQVAESINVNLEAGALISDDLFLSISQLREAGLWTGSVVMLVMLGALFAIYLSLVTLSLQVHLARRWFGEDIFAESEQVRSSK